MLGDKEILFLIFFMSLLLIITIVLVTVIPQNKVVNIEAPNYLGDRIY